MSAHRYLGLILLVVLLAGCLPAGRESAASDAARPAAETGRAAPAPASAGWDMPGAVATPRSLERIVLPIAAPSGGFLAPVLAQHKGFFREEGLDAEMPIMRTNLIASGLVSGEVDYTAQASPAVRNALAGMPFKLVAVTVDKSTRWIVSVPGIRSVQDLKGKTVAVNAIGSSPHDSGILALEQLGMDPQADVTWLAAGTPAERFLTLQQGGAQATVLGGSELMQADALGLTRLLRLEEVAPLPENALGASTAKLESNRGQVKRVVRAVVRSLQFIKNDREGTLPVLMQFLSLPRADAEEIYDTTVYSFSDDGTVSERSMRFMIEAEKRALKLTDDVPTSRVADFGLLYEVLAELGITPAEGSAR